MEESLTGIDSWWLGLTDMGHEGRYELRIRCDVLILILLLLFIFRWISGHSATESEFTAWAPGHPNSAPHNMDDCVSISFSDHYLWRDVPCYEKTTAAPICQRDIQIETTTTQATTTAFPGSSICMLGLNLYTLLSQVVLLVGLSLELAVFSISQPMHLGHMPNFTAKV